MRPLDVNREAVKTLAIAVGLKEAAVQTGIPYDTIRQWSSRGNWFAPAPIPVTMQKQSVTGVTVTPSTALQATLSDRKEQTRLNLSKYAIEASARAAGSKGNLDMAGQVRHVAAILPAVWPEAQVAAVNIALLNGELGMG